MLEYKTLRRYYEDAIHLKIVLQMSKCDKKDICEALAPIKEKIRTMYREEETTEIETLKEGRERKER